MGGNRHLWNLFAAVVLMGTLASGDAGAEVKDNVNPAAAPVGERQSATASWELICYQAGREIVHERGLKSVATPGGPGALITYTTASNTPAYVVVGTESTCISRPEGPKAR